MTPVRGIYALSPAPLRRATVPVSNRYLPLDDQGQQRRREITLGDYSAAPKKPRRGKAVFAAPLACSPSCSPYVSAITAYTPASQAPEPLRSMAFSSSSLTLTSPTVTVCHRSVAGSISPVPSDGSNPLVPSDGSVGSHGGVGTEVLCSEFFCFQDEETVVLRFENKKIDQTYCDQDSSIVSSCCFGGERQTKSET